MCPYSLFPLFTPRFPNSGTSFRAAQKRVIAVHARAHTGEKPYVCDVCSYACNRKDQLARCELPP